MKKITCFMTAMLLLCSAVFVVPASAAEQRISNQIYDYTIAPTADNGKVKVEFYVLGVGTMDKIGCERIDIYEKIGSSWVSVESLTENDPGMSKTNTYTHKNTISYNGKAGASYKVVVTIFAENGDGRDTRTKTTYL